MYAVTAAVDFAGQPLPLPSRSKSAPKPVDGARLLDVADAEARANLGKEFFVPPLVDDFTGLAAELAFAVTKVGRAFELLRLDRGLRLGGHLFDFFEKRCVGKNP